MSAPFRDAFAYELLVELTEAHGVPGYEEEIRAIVRRELEVEVDELTWEAMGNLVGTTRIERDHAVVVAAHMDEIGFMVRHVAAGVLSLDALGGFDPRVFQAQRVLIHTADGSIPGVVGSLPPHTSDEEARKKIPEAEDIAVDLAMTGEEVGLRGAYALGIDPTPTSPSPSTSRWRTTCSISTRTSTSRGSARPRRSSSRTRA